MSKKYVPQGSFLYCDKGVFPTPFLGLEYTEVYLTDVPIATDYDDKPLFNVLPFGPCIAKGGQFCLPAPTSTWNDPSATFCGLVAKPILDDSTLSCVAPGTIRIAPSFMAALLEMYDDPGELMDKLLEYMGAKAENSLHFGWGILKGAWETVKFVYTLAVETSPLIQGYQALTDWEGFSDKWEGRYETGKDVVEFGIQLYELSNDPVKQAQLFAYLSDGDNWERAFEAVYNKVAYADHTEVAEVQGMIAFEILLEVLTSGFGAARHIDKLDDLSDGARVISSVMDNLDDPAIVADRLEDLAPDEIIRPADDIPDGPAGETITGRADGLTPGSPAHKTQRWKEYQERGGQWSYERWSKTYDNNMVRARVANQAVDDYHETIGWGEREVTVDVDGQARRLDIADTDAMRGVEMKSGDYFSRTADIRSEIARDRKLVERGWEIDWVIEGRASQPLLDELREAGINVIHNP